MAMTAVAAARRLGVTANVRFAGVVATPDELRTALGDAAARSSVPRGEPRPLAFLFSGQGSQYAGMGAALYRAHPAFREALDRCATLLETRLDRPLLDIMFTTPDPAGRLDQTRRELVVRTAARVRPRIAP